MIGLMDCNNFFVSCERLFRPDLLKKPVAVLSSNDGCIVARSQEVKDLNVPMGVPYFQVKDVLTKAHTTLFSSNFTLYRDISARVMQTLEKEVGLCEVYSIDEAFFELPDDITEDEVLHIRAQIMKKVGLPVSIGVSSTKTLAKQASSIAKKNTGVCILHKLQWEQIMCTTPCGSIWGVGRQTSVKLREMGINNVGEFLSMTRTIVRRDFGVVGERIQNELSGVCMYPLGFSNEETPQSIMSTRSFEKTTSNLSDLQSAIGYHVTEVAQKLREKKLLASRMTVLILPSRHGDFLLHQGKKEIVFTEPTSQTFTMLAQAQKAVRDLVNKEVPYKKAGVVVAGLIPQTHHTQSLFTPHVNQHERSLDTITDILNERFGHGTVRSGVVLQNGPRASAKLRSQEYTTSWKDIPSVYAK